MKVNRPMIVGAAILSACSMMFTGCASTGGGDPLEGMVASALKDVPTGLQDAMKGYIGDLTNINQLLTEVENSTQALASVPKLKPYADNVNSYLKQLAGASPGDLTSLREGFAKPLETATSDFKTQRDRILNSESLKSALSPVLSKFQLFPI
jgi:hypothetical protein